MGLEQHNLKYLQPFVDAVRVEVFDDVNDAFFAPQSSTFGVPYAADNGRRVQFRLPYGFQSVRSARQVVWQGWLPISLTAGSIHHRDRPAKQVSVIHAG